MSVLLDTNILVRLANTSDSVHVVASQAVLKLHRLGESVLIFPQNLVEFRNVATRPKAVNGLGLSIPDAEAKAAIFEATFTLLPETPGIFPAWKALVSGLGIIGKQVHDARLVAACHVHIVPRLLTFNVSHFARMTTFSPGIVVIDPANV